jgi:hypothetical protein
MFLHILDEQRIDVLKKIIEVHPSSFYLAGGTALALQIGHRDSIDFDWFSSDLFDLNELAESLAQIGHFVASYKQKNTLHGFLDEVQLTYLYYPIKMLEPFEQAEGYRLAGLTDIALMKLIAISQRGAKKDFIDLFALMLMGKFTWKFLFDSLYLKFQDRPPNPYHLARSLVFFDDADLEPTPKMYVDWNWEDVKKYLLDEQQVFSEILFDRE